MGGGERGRHGQHRQDNCLYASNPDGRYNGGIITGSPLGFTAKGNAVAEPGFVDRTNKVLTSHRGVAP